MVFVNWFEIKDRIWERIWVEFLSSNFSVVGHFSEFLSTIWFATIVGLNDGNGHFVFVFFKLPWKWNLQSNYKQLLQWYMIIKYNKNSTKPAGIWLQLFCAKQWIKASVQSDNLLSQVTVFKRIFKKITIPVVSTVSLCQLIILCQLLVCYELLKKVSFKGSLSKYYWLTLLAFLDFDIWLLESF